jgi:hypothetical protein
MIPGGQNKRATPAMVSDAIVKTPTRKSRQRFFRIISPPQVLHLLTRMSASFKTIYRMRVPSPVRAEQMVLK